MSQKTKKTFHKRPQHEEETETTLYEGRNEVMELLRAGRTVDKLFVAPDQNGRMADIVAMAKAAGAVVTQVDRRKLDAMRRQRRMNMSRWRIFCRLPQTAENSRSS